MANITIQPVLTSITVRVDVEGIHRYPAAAEDPRLADVSFLSFPHRHIFQIEATIQVFHDDRELEFILVKRDLQQAFGQGILQLDYKSCEMINNDVAQYLANRYGANRIYVVSTSEDGENKATSTYITQALSDENEGTNTAATTSDG